MKTSYFFWMVCLGFFASLTAQAQQIGYVDAEYVLGKMPEYKKVQEEMKTYEETASTEIKSKEEEFQKKVKELEEMAKATNPNESLLQVRYSELQEMEKQMQELQQSLQQEYSDELNKKLVPVEEKFQKAVDDISAEKGGMYILRRESLLFELEENNVSDAVLRKLGISPTDSPANRGSLKSTNKLGYFNSNQIIPQIPEYKQAQKQIETYNGKLQENLESQKSTIEQKAQQLEQMEQSATASADAKKRLRDEIQTLQAALQNAAQEAQTKAQKKYTELINPILEKVQTTIEQVAKENGHTYVFKVETILYEPNDSNLSGLVGKKLGVADSTATSASTSQTQNKIGHFDLQYILPQLPEYKSAEAEMTVYAKQIQDELKSKQDEFQMKLKDYQTRSEAGTLSPALKASKERELQTLQQQFERFQQGVQQDAQGQEAKLMAPIYEKVQKALDEVAKEGNYTFVLRAEACYASPKTENISDRVLRKMGITPKN